MSDTPETDNLARGNHVVPTEFAEQLERERDSLIASLKFHAELNKELVAERDELENKLEKSKSYKNVMRRDNAELRKQLDRLAAALEYILGIGLTQKTKAKAEKALQYLTKKQWVTHQKQTSA